MKKYFGVIKRDNASSPYRLNLEAKSLGDALDDMFYYVGAERQDQVEEYELYEVIGNNKYVPVASKIRSTKTPSTALVPAKPTGVRYYTSYKD